MTLLVAWAAVDTHGTSSMYIASDSRISWGNEATYDRGRKVHRGQRSRAVFAFQKYPDILGYCGDVLFPSLALNQIVDLADAGLLFGFNFNANDKFQAIVDKLNDLAREYPRLHAGLEENSLSAIHGSRQAHIDDQFSCRKISWSKKEGWSGENAPMPKQSDVLFALGSGAGIFSENLVRYKQGPTAGTTEALALKTSCGPTSLL